MAGAFILLAIFFIRFITVLDDIFKYRDILFMPIPSFTKPWIFWFVDGLQAL
jgi:hypothetical protein